MSDIVAIYVNIHCENFDEAKKLSTYLLQNKLAGTIKITSDVYLMSMMDDKVQGDDSVLMTIKTTQMHLKDIEEYIYKNHSWGHPCIEVFPIITDHC